MSGHLEKKVNSRNIVTEDVKNNVIQALRGVTHTFLGNDITGIEACPLRVTLSRV